MSRTYALTKDAEADLIRIWLETEARWGEAQADRYQDDLHACFQRIVDGIAATRPVEGMREVRHHLCSKHILFYTEQQETVVILAVLHERMDLPQHLAQRLSQGE